MAQPPGLLGRAAARVEAVMRAARGASETTVADLPSAGRSTPPDAATRKILQSWGVMESRIGPAAGPLKTRWALWPGDDLTPETIISAQREAVTSGIPLRWVELIDQVFSRDGHYSSCSNQRVADIIKGTWRLVPAFDDDVGAAMCNFTDEAYRNCSRWNDGLGWLLYSNLYGFNSFEIEWYATTITFQGPKNETIGPVEVALPRKIHNLHPKHYRFDIQKDDPLFWLGNSYQPLPYGKIVFMEGDGLHPTTLRRGHAWQCIWYSLFRSMSWASWAVHVDRFSLPVPLITYDGGVDQYAEYKVAWEEILNSLGSGKGAIIPKTAAEIEIKDPPQGGRSNDPASALSDACDAGQSIRVLGGQLNNKIGNVGSFSASTNHLDIKYSLEELDAARMWERIDEQFTAPMLRFNAEALADALNEKGYRVTPQQIMRRVPRGKHHIPGKTDPEAEIRIMKEAVAMGLDLSASGAFARMDFQKARNAKDRIPGATQVISKGGALVTDSEASQDGGYVNPDVAAEKTADVAEKTANAAPAEKPAEKPEPVKQERAKRPRKKGKNASDK